MITLRGIGAGTLIAIGAVLFVAPARAETKGHTAKVAKHTATPLEREAHRHNRRMAQLNREREAAGRANDKPGVTRAAKKVAVELKQHAAKNAELAKAAAKKQKKQLSTFPSETFMPINVNKAVDRAYETKTLKEIAAAPVSAIEGISDNGAKLLNELGIHTIKDLGEWKFAKWARSIVELSELED